MLVSFILTYKKYSQQLNHTLMQSFSLEFLVSFLSRLAHMSEMACWHS